jgi:hypothetical protein
MKHFITKRRRFSSVDQAQLLCEYQGSGLTHAEFVQRHGLKLSTFQRWLYQPKASPARLKFREVPLPALLSQSAWVAEVGWSGGRTLRISAAAQPELIRFLLEGLEPAAC